MKHLALVTVLVLLASTANAGTAFLKRNYISGLNRICVYDHLGSEVIITIKSTEICKVTVQI
ncbi:hypothetical protein [Microbulbifer sp. THAF38]|uniref:hypothetical protein n=1 Tax=Microbulbifer sp. THAF38 TaxID=2587856 RepID=UPI001268E1E1|nr:hypothetical protein [Microbulbifer sp. THAF38]QFT57148.1 hypothetical protein FIU95_21585 [Microbulbifer sp. THAF38]